MLERRYTPLGRFNPDPSKAGRSSGSRRLLGFVAMSLDPGRVARSPNSPFKLDMPNTWFFGEPSPKFTVTPSETTTSSRSSSSTAGCCCLMRVWLRLAEVMKLHPGLRIKSLWWMLLLWATPMIVAPPLFSRDVFSYAAQGEMTAAHISPYLFGPFTLGSGPYVNPVDPLWGNAPAPYGPFFLFLDGTIDRITVAPPALDGRRSADPRDAGGRHDRLRRRAARHGFEPRPRRGLRPLAR